MKKEKDEIKEDDFLEKKRKKEILAELDEIDMEPAPIISSGRPKKEKNKKDTIINEEEQEASDDWLATIDSFKVEPIKRGKRKKQNSIFDYYDENGKKRKKKKKKKDELTDYNKEFEPETALLKNLLIDQNRFVDELQKKYNAMETTKSSQRGIGKFTTDLITAINSGRNVSMQLIEKIINTKKTIADLSMKEKKELASKIGEDLDLGNFSSQFLRQMLNEGRETVMNGGENTISDYTEDELYDTINEGLIDEQNDAEIDKYLKYEKDDVTIYAIFDTRTSDISFEARSAEDNVITDYPLPEVEGVDVNRSTDIATDKYGRKYPVIYT